MRWFILFALAAFAIFACTTVPKPHRVYTQDGWYEFRQIEPVETCCPKR